jgi:hypothetical protein
MYSHGFENLYLIVYVYMSTKVKTICTKCNKEFFKWLKDYKRIKKLHFCSTKCQNERRDNKIIKPCSNCGQMIKRQPGELKKSKEGRIFCNRSCAATYNNQHKTSGTRVSKLEIWLQQQLSSIYPNLEIHFNRKDAINSEIDIYIPSLKLAFELNGIFHYEPIYGEDKLKQIQNNDDRKFAACHEANISLCIIDTSGQKYFKPSTSQKYLDIIVKFIENNIKNQ